MTKPPTKPLTDEEFEARIRRNLAAPDDGPTVADIGTDGRGGIDAALAGLDELFADPVLSERELADLAATLDNLPERDRVRQVVSDAVTRYGPGSEIATIRGQQRNAALSARQRAEYASRIAQEEGRPVRKRLLREEDRRDRKAETRRIRYAASKDGEVRRYNRLASMSTEDRAAYRREQARIRQKQKRERDGSKKENSSE